MNTQKNDPSKKGQTAQGQDNSKNTENKNESQNKRRNKVKKRRKAPNYQDVKHALLLQDRKIQVNAMERCSN